MPRKEKRMAQSPTFGTSNVYIKYIIYVTVNSQSITNNTSNITVGVWCYRSNSGYQTYGPGTCYCNINTVQYSQAITSSQIITENGIYLFSKTLDIGHNNDGTKSIWISSYISHSQFSSSDQGFTVTLPTIARAATCTGADNFTDEQNPKISFSNPAGFKLQLKIEVPSDTFLIVRDNLYPSSPYTFQLTETERNKLRALIPNANSGTFMFTVGTYMPGSSSPSNHSWVNRTMTLINANPVFNNSQLSYKDINTTVTAITGDNQFLVRNNSNLQVTFTSATAQKYATMSKYQIIFNGVTQTVTSAGMYNLGTVDSSKNLSLQVKAIDSRGNSTTISKTVQVLDWIAPIINASASRINNYENETKIIPNVQISDVNGLNTLQTLQYRVKKTTDSTWGLWSNLANYVSTQVSLNNLFAWDIQVKAEDKFGSSTQNLSIPKGMPIMFFDTQKLSVGINCFPNKSESFEVNGKTIWDMIYPVGSVYLSINNANPGTIFGGTWASWGTGRVPVGVDTSQTEFNTVQKTGGAKTHTLSTSEMPSHTHTVICEFGANPNSSYSPGGAYSQVASSSSASKVPLSSINSTGSGNAHNNLPPYITCYMWRRTA